MQFLFFLLFSLSFLLPSCDTQKREQALQLRDLALTQKEQELTIREQALKAREEELAKKQMDFDSTTTNSVDSIGALHPNLSGIWNVTMRCMETTCPTSAVGDTKTEQWEIGVENNRVTARARSDKKLLRIYSGSYLSNSFVLSAPPDNVPDNEANIIVRFQPTNENEMSGQREVIRPNDCRVVYSLEFRKQM